MTVAPPFDTSMQIEKRTPQPALRMLAATRFGSRIGSKLKMIRRLGHFVGRRDGRHIQCSRHFFDGKYCSKEIQELLCQYLRDNYGDLLPVLIYDVPLSRWLEDPLLGVAARCDIPCYSIEEAIELKPPELMEPSARPVLLVCPMVDSGNTIASLLARLQSSIPSVHVNSLSILSTDGEDHSFGTRHLRTPAGSIDVVYILRVQQETSAPDECHLCELRVPPSSYDDEPYHMLTSYDFWDIVARSGTKVEEDVPLNRVNQGTFVVPDIPRMLDDHGPWLASKLCDLLAFATNEAVEDTIVVCPDEKGSQVLARYLEQVADAEVILIPRQVISTFYHSDPVPAATKAALEVDRPPWYVKLTTAVRSDFVVMDEFNKSGGTRAALRRLLFAFNKSVQCYVTLVDFNPKIRESERVPSYALYELQAHK